MSLLPLGILPLGGHRGCLPSLPGHSTLKEPKTRKVLTKPAAKRWERIARAEAPPLGRQAQALPPRPTTENAPWPQVSSVSTSVGCHRALQESWKCITPLELALLRQRLRLGLKPKPCTPEGHATCSSASRRPWRQLTFRNIPRDASEEHLAGVDGVLVVPGRKLATPGTGGFIHSLGKRQRNRLESQQSQCPALG